MAAPNDSVKVCNLSLSLLRHSEKMTSIETPESDLEFLGSEWYDLIREALLRSHPWNFARKRKMIPLDSADPVFGDLNKYVLPNDYLGYVFIGEDPETDYETDFLIEGEHVLISYDDAASLPMCYIQNIDEVSKFDPIFTNLLVGELALVFGSSIVGYDKSLKKITDFRDRWEAKARAKNGQENPAIVRYKSLIISARNNIQGGTQTDGQHLL